MIVAYDVYVGEGPQICDVWHKLYCKISCLPSIMVLLFHKGYRNYMYACINVCMHACPDCVQLKQYIASELSPIQEICDHRLRHEGGPADFLKDVVDVSLRETGQAFADSPSRY